MIRYRIPFFSLVWFLLLGLFSLPAWAQTTVTFEDVVEDDLGVLGTTYTNGGLRFELIPGSNSEAQISTASGGGASGSMALDDSNIDQEGVKGWKITKADGSTFQFVSIWLQEGCGCASVAGTVKAYKAGGQVGASVNVNFDSRDNGLKNFSANPDFYEVDEVRIEAFDIYLLVDNVTYGTAIPTGDNDPPVVTGINLVGTPFSSATTVDFVVNFSKAAENVSMDDFQLTTAGTIGSISGLTGSGTTYTVTVNGIDGEGTIRLDLKAGTDITNEDDVAGTPPFTGGQLHYVGSCYTETFESKTDGATSFPSNGRVFTLGTGLEIENRSGFGAGPSNRYIKNNITPGTFSITADDKFTAGSVDLFLSDQTNGFLPTGTGTLTIVGRLGGVPQFTITKNSGFPTEATVNNGFFTVYFATEGGTDHSNVNIDELTFTIGDGFKELAIDNFNFCEAIPDVDSQAPAIQSLTVVGTPESTAGTVSFQAVFNESALNVTLDDFSLNKTGTAEGTLAGISGSGTTYLLQVTGISGEGTLQVKLNGGTDIADGLGNAHPIEYVNGQLHYVGACYVERFEALANGAKAFVSNGKQFSLTGNWEVRRQNGYGIHASNAFLLNTGAGPFSLKADDVPVAFSQLALYLSSNATGTTPTGDGTLTIRGKLNGATAYEIVKNTGFPTDFGTTNGFFFVNFASDGGSDYSAVFVDELEIELGGSFVYVALDDLGYCSDFDAPAGYTVQIDQDPINQGNETAVGFTFAGAEVGTAYHYSFTSSGGGTAVSASGTIVTATQQVTGIDLSGLNPGTVTLRVTLTDASGNVGAAATHTAEKVVNHNPTDITLSNTTVNQSGGANASVGTLGSTDEDAGNTFTYSLVTGEGDTDNTSFNLSDNNLRANNPAGLAAGDYSIRIRTTDNDGGFFEKMFTVTVVDNVAPTVTSVTLPANNTYHFKQNLDFTVIVSEGVTVTNIPRIALTIGDKQVNAGYQADQSSENELLFRYIVQAGDLDTDGIMVGGAIDLNGGMITDAAGNGLNVTLNAVGSTADITVDGVLPTVTSVDVPTDGTYGIGADLDFTVHFDEEVTVNSTDGNPLIALVIGSAERFAAYQSGSGTQELVFRYTVTGTDPESAIDRLGWAIDLNEGKILDLLGNPIAENLNNVGSTDDIYVDGVRPAVTSIDIVDTALETGETSSVTIAFSEAVTGLDNSSVTAQNGSLSAFSSADGGLTWTATLTPNRNVDEPENVMTLDLAGVSDAGGNAGVGTVASGHYTIQTRLYTQVVTSLLDTGDDGTMAATWAEDEADGDGLSLREALYWAHPDDTITFAQGGTITLNGSELTLTQSNLTVNGDLDDDGIPDVTVSGDNASRVIQVESDRTGIEIIGLILTKGAGDGGGGGGLGLDMDAEVTLRSCVVTDNQESGQTGGGGIFGSRVTLRIINSTISNNSASEYGGGVRVVGNGVLHLMNTTVSGNVTTGEYKHGGGIHYAGPDFLMINCTVSGNSASGSGAIGGGLRITGGVAKVYNSTIVGNMASDNGGGVSANGPDDQFFNTVVAGNSAGGSPDDVSGTLEKGINNFFGTEVTISEGNGNLNNQGTDNLLLGDLADNGGLVQTHKLLIGSVLINAGSAADLPADTYDLDGDGNTTEPLPLDVTGGTRVFGPAPDIGAVEIVTPPEVTAVASVAADGTYKIGDNIQLTVTFDQPVVVDVTGDLPGMLLETGDTDRNAVYVKGSGSNTLTFSYTVQADDVSADLDYTSAATIQLNGSTIKNTLGVDAVLDLPEAGSAASIAGQHDIVIDGIAPEVISVAASADGYYVEEEDIEVTVRFDDAVTVDLDGGTPYVELVVGTATVQAAYVSGSGSDALVFGYTVQAEEVDLDGISVGDLQTGGGTLRDAAGNDAIRTLNNISPTDGVLVYALPLSVTLSTAAELPVHALFTVQAVFSDEVSKFTLADIRVVNGTASFLQTVDNKSFLFLVTPDTGGEIQVSLPADAAFNIADVGNEASETLKVQFDEPISGITLEDGSFGYDGSVKSLEIDGTLPAGASVAYTIDGATGNGATDAGVYEVTATVSGDNYQTLVLTAELTISPREITVTAADAEKVYGNDDPALTYTYVPELASGDTFTGALSRGADEDVGSYVITAGNLSLGDNYTMAFESGTLTITPLEITVTADNQSKVFGSDDPALTYTFSPELIGTDTFTGGLSRADGENAGSYAITRGNLSLNDNYTINFETGTLDITSATITGITFDGAIFTYDGLEHHLSLVGDLPAGTAVGYTIDGATGNGATDAGVYEVTATVSGDNYQTLELTATLTITPLEITVTADNQSKVFGSDDPALTYTFSPELIGADEFTGGLSRADGENAGSYAITRGNLSLNDNYTINFETGTLDITPAAITGIAFDGAIFTYDGLEHHLSLVGDLPAGTAVGYTIDGATGNGATDAGVYEVTAMVSGDNYQTLELTATLTITPLEITVTADNQSKVFGTDDPALTYTFSPELIGTDTFTGALTREEGENAGSYAITRGNLSLNDNYTLVVEAGTLTITSADYVGIALNNLRTIYDGREHRITLVGDLPAGASVAYTIDGATGNGATDAGVYEVNALIDGGGNYDDLELTATLTITPLEITVTADNQSKVFGAGDPALTYTFSPELIGTDTFTGALSRAEGENVGSYAIVQGNLSLDDNYAIAFGTGVLTITAAEEPEPVDPTPITGITLRDASFTYNGTAQSLEIDGSLPEGASVTYGHNRRTAVGSQEVTATISGDGFETLVLTATLTIRPAERTLNFPALPAKVYGDTDFEVGATVSSGEVISYTSSNPAVAEVDADGTITLTGVGETMVTATVPENSNYTTRPTVSRTLTVAKAAQTITFAEVGELRRDAGTVPLDVTASSGLPVTLTIDDEEVATLNGMNLTILRLGTVRITATQAGDANHEPAEPVTVTVRVTDPSAELPVRVSKVVSPNGDGINEYLVIEAIKDYPDNRVSIFNRNGTVVWEASGYNNGTVVFRGIGTGQYNVPAGTYFYVAEIRVGNEVRYEKGWFVLRY